MNWKEFFKPTTKSLIVFMALFLFFPVIFPWLANDCPMYEYAPGMNIEPCNKIAVRISFGWVMTAIYEEFTRPATWITEHLEIRSLPPRYFPEYYLYHLVITYLLSCLIVSLHFKKAESLKKLFIKIWNTLNKIPIWIGGGLIGIISLGLIIFSRVFNREIDTNVIAFIVIPIRPALDYLETINLLLSILLAFTYFFTIGAAIAIIVKKVGKNKKFHK